jgi:hypothetical protein
MRQIDLRNDLIPVERRRTYAHELGHVIDDLVRQIRTKRLQKELDDVYNELNNPNRHTYGAAPVRPEDFGYTGEDVAREYMAEAIRAYLWDPNYIKTVAPNTAAAIRAAVRKNLWLAKIIRFNSALAPIAGADVLGSADGEGLHNEDAHKKATGDARIDPSDPRTSDRLPIEDWMKLRNQQKR